MTKVCSALKAIYIACLLNTDTVFGTNGGSLDSLKLHGDLDDGSCEIGADGIVTCKDDEEGNESTCTDDNERCHHWASKGECDKNPSFMLDVCKKSCNKCKHDGAVNCTDDHDQCNFWASKGQCDDNPSYMLEVCTKSCNSCAKEEEQELEQHDYDTMNRRERNYYMTAIQEYGTPQTAIGEKKGYTISKVRDAVLYMRNYVNAKNATHNMPRHVIDSCQNKKDLCAYWAVIGECESNEAFMTTNCASVCQSCHNIDINVRCGKRDPDERAALNKGELNLMFERIVQMAPGNQTEASRTASLEGKVQDDGTPYYTVNIHSRPKSSSPRPDNDTGVIPVDSNQDRDEDPWVITMDNFLTEEECELLIQSGYKNGYKRSMDVGGVKFDGSLDSMESTSRTSANTWCNEKSGCKTNPHVKRILRRLETTTKIPTKSFEDFQILKYEVGQFYRIHHDYIPIQNDRLCGPRILTFFLYLNDVDKGGGTGFADLDIVISPKKGRALLWSSVFNHDPSVKDGRTRHEALAVEKGTKYAANAWIHLYNYEDAQKRGCQ